MISNVEGVYSLTALIAFICAFVFYIKAMNRVTNDEAIFQTKFRFFYNREHFTPQGYKYIKIAYIFLAYAIIPYPFIILIFRNPF